MKNEETTNQTTNTKTDADEIITAMCDLCGDGEINRRITLERSGWHLGSQEEFCWECNSKD